MIYFLLMHTFVYKLNSENNKPRLPTTKQGYSDAQPTHLIACIQ